MSETRDIVAELRKLHREIVESDGGECEMMRKVREGLEEIERLRAEIKALNRVARAAKVLSMKWMTIGMKIDGDEFLGAIEDLHEAICRLYGVDPIRGFRFKESDQ